LANTKSAKKSILVNERRRIRNRIHRGRARTEIKKARKVIASGDLTASVEAVRQAVKWIDHAASKGVLHKNNAARRKSRLMKRLAQLEAAKK